MLRSRSHSLEPDLLVRDSLDHANRDNIGEGLRVDVSAVFSFGGVSLSLTNDKRQDECPDRHVTELNQLSSKARAAEDAVLTLARPQ